MPTRVLIVEDEDAVRELLAEYLRGRGLEVVERATAGDGLRALAEQPFDLLVTDLKLPDGEGLDLVRAAAARPAPPVTVVMSGYATVDDAISVLTLGAADLLLKPFRLRDAHATLQRALGRGAEDRRRRLAEVVLAWLEAVGAARTPADLEPLLPALHALVATWSPGSVLEIQAEAVPGAVAIGEGRYARVQPGDARIEAWLHLFGHAARGVGC